MTESDLVYTIRRDLSVGDTRLFRNNVGFATDARGNHMKFGLCTGSADLIGWRTMTVKPVDVGNDIAIFCAIEAKTLTGRLTFEQRQFLEAVKRAGGLAGVARSLDEAKRIIGVDRF